MRRPRILRHLASFSVVTVLVVLAVGSTDSGSQTGGGRRTPSAAPSSEPLLELQSWHWSMQHGFAIAEGTVKNISKQKLENVEVVVMFKDRDDHLITTGEALIAYNPILPGQTSPFKAMATANPAMAKSSIDFKRLMGGSIRWKRIPREE